MKRKMCGNARRLFPPKASPEFWDLQAIVEPLEFGIPLKSGIGPHLRLETEIRNPLFEFQLLLDLLVRMKDNVEFAQHFEVHWLPIVHCDDLVASSSVIRVFCYLV